MEKANILGFHVLSKSHRESQSLWLKMAWTLLKRAMQQVYRATPPSVKRKVASVFFPVAGSIAINTRKPTPRMRLSQNTETLFWVSGVKQ